MIVAVIGAGPAGATAAYELAKRGISVHLFEASGFVGGLARSIPLWGQTVDLGPHRFFSRDKRVNALWLEVVGRDYLMLDRLTRIYYDGKLYHYPLRPGNALRNLGFWEATRCVGSYLRQKFASAPQASTFESWVTHRFGRRLYEIFFKTYSEKLWGIPCTELDSSFAAQRIKKVSLGAAIRNAFCADRQPGKKTFVDQFAYPLEGTGMVYRRMVEFVERHGGAVSLNTPIQRIVVDDPRAVGLELPDGSIHHYDRIISSMPISILVRCLPGTPEDVLEVAASLRFRNTILVYLRVASATLFPDNWLYIHSKRLRTGRITNFRNWSPALYGDEPDTIVALEYWANDDDELWHEADAELIRLATAEFVATGLSCGARITAGHVERVRRCYPVYRKGYQDQVSVIRQYLDGIEHLQAIGRYGTFKYNNQDHSILMGLLAAENIADDAGHDLWAINTDYEDYQEVALITESGLEMF